MATSLPTTGVFSEAFQAFAMELGIFCITIAVAVALKVSSFNSGGCAASLLQLWPWRALGRPASANKLRACSTNTCQQSTAKNAPLQRLEPMATIPRTAQAAGGRTTGIKSIAQGPARSLETIMERANSKNAMEALTLYAAFRSSSHQLNIQALLRSTRHSGLDFFSAMVQSAVRAGEPQMVEQYLYDMARAKIERTLSFYESVMKVLAGKKHYRQALAVYTRLDSEGFKASPVTLSCLINFAAELGDLDSAIGFFEQLAATSTPSIRAYMVALRVYSKRQNWPKSLEVFRNMQARNVAIDSLVINSVLATGASAGKTEASEAFLHEMAKTNAEIVDVIAYNTVLKGFAHQKNACKALEMLDLMSERGVKPNCITFNTVMDAAVRGSQTEDAWNVLERMSGCGLRPDKYTCTILMKNLHEDATPKQLSKVLEIIQSALPHCDSALCSSLFRAMVQVAARLNNTALLMHAFRQMQVQHVMLTTADYELMLQTLSQQGCTTHCSTIWRDVFSPDRTHSIGQHEPHTAMVVVIFTSVMEELAKREEIEGMICVFESLRAVVAVSEPENLKEFLGSPGSQKSLERKVPHILQQCRAALIQAASRRQHSSPALKRLLELAPEHLSLETVKS